MNIYINSRLIRESVSGVKLYDLILNNELVYMVCYPLLPGEVASSKNVKVIKNREEAELCYESFIRGYEYAKAN